MVIQDEKIKFDDIDIQILQILQQDGRITNTRLASMVGLSAPPMLERVKKLERAGIIKGYRAILDAQLLGRDFFVFVSINLDVAELPNVERFEQLLGALEPVMECHHIAGDIDFLLKVNVGGPEDYKQFVIDHLAKISGINRIHSYVVLSTIKDTTELTIDGDQLKKQGR